MRNSISDPRQFIITECRLTIVIAFIFASQMISAQQKFTIQLTTGINQQVPVEGLKITFDNNGSFTCWQNGVKQDMAFASVGKIYFTDLILPTKTDENISMKEALKVYPNPTTGMITLELTQNSGGRAEISVSNLDGAEVLRKEFDNAAKHQLDLSNLKSGIYFLKVIIDNEQYISKTVIRKE